jgi:hypothetical protein
MGRWAAGGDIVDGIKRCSHSPLSSRPAFCHLDPCDTSRHGYGDPNLFALPPLRNN